jgi:hypothetical protein
MLAPTAVEEVAGATTACRGIAGFEPATYSYSTVKLKTLILYYIIFIMALPDLQITW